MDSFQERKHKNFQVGGGDDKSLAHVNIGWMDRVYFSMNHYADKIVKFLRIDKL